MLDVGHAVLGALLGQLLYVTRPAKIGHVGT